MTLISKNSSVYNRCTAVVDCRKSWFRAGSLSSRRKIRGGECVVQTPNMKLHYIKLRQLRKSACL